nr:hypothetical protein [Tanacetum cinerariifolium]
IYLTRVTKDAESSFSLSPRQMTLWKPQKEDHTSDWLRVVLISGMGQAMNDKAYRCDYAVSCTGSICIKHQHNAMHDTLVDVCFWSGILAGKEVGIELGGGGDKVVHPTDMLLYSWDCRLDVCMDVTWSSPLAQTGMADFVPGWAVIDAAQRKHGKYMAKYVAIGYGFLPFSFLIIGGIRGKRGYIAKEDPEVFHDSRHQGTCSYSYL